MKELVRLLTDKSGYIDALFSIAEVIENEGTRKAIRTQIIESNNIGITLGYLFDPEEKVREKVSYILCLLAFEDEGRILIADNGGINQLFAVASDTSKSVYQREKCLYAISNIANHKAIRPRIIAANGDELLITFVKQDTAKLIVPSCTALSKLIKLDDDTCSKVVNSGLLEHLLKLAGHSDNDLAVAAIEGMGKLFDFMASPRTHAGKCGVYEGLLQILKGRNDENPGIKVLRASDTMNLLLVNNLSNRQLAWKNGCFSEHIKMLKTNNKDLVEKALNFLRNFTENFKDGQEEMMRDSSVVPILLRLLKEGNKITLGALCHMSQNENAKSLMPIHLIESTLTPLMSSSGLTDIERARVAIILANLSDCDKAGSLAIDPKVIKFLAQKTAETLVGDEDRWSLLTFVNGIANLAANITNKELIGAEGIIKSLFDILQVDPKKCTHGRVLTYLDESKATAATALWNLAYYEPNRCRMRDVGGVEVLKELAGTILEERLRKNIKGTLWLLGVRDKGISSPYPTRNQNGKEARVPPDILGAHVLVSYSLGHQDLAKKVAVVLRKNGYRVWLDIYQAGGGTLEEVALGIRNSKAVLVLLCRQFKNSPSCRFMIEQAIAHNKELFFICCEPDFKPDGWLEGIIGTSTLYNLSLDTFEAKFAVLLQEIELVRERMKDSLEVNTSTSASWSSPANFYSWPADEVANWLEKHGLSRYQAPFSEHSVDGSTLKILVQLGKQDIRGLSNMLQRYFGVKSQKHQSKLLSMIDKLGTTQM